MSQQHDYPFKSWQQQAAKHPGFIGYALALLRQRDVVIEEQQREAVGIPLEAQYDPVWLHLQAMSFPRPGEHFEQDVQKIADYITQKVQEHHQLPVTFRVQGLLDLLSLARKEMAQKLTALQPFAVTVPGRGMLVADNVGPQYLLYLPEGVEEATVELHVAPSGGGDYVREWAGRIRACPDNEQAAKLLISFSLTMAEAMTSRMLDNMSDLLGVPRMASE